MPDELRSGGRGTPRLRLEALLPEVDRCAAGWKVPLALARAGLGPGAKVTLPGRQMVSLPGGDDRYVRDRKAVLPDKGEWHGCATISVPAGATITLPGGTIIPGRAAAGLQVAADFTELPGQAGATLKSGATLTVPPGAVITVWPAQPGAAFPVLALPGASDITVFAGQRIKISPWATIAAADVTMYPPAPAPPPPPAPPGYRLGQDQHIRLPGGAKISFLGRASLELPAGTLVAAPGSRPEHTAKRCCLKTTTVFPLPHTAQVIASQMWSMLLASCLTLFGTGAELGILGVLALSLSSADFTVRVVCVIAAAVAAAVVWVYSVVSISALADPMPGDALNATGGTSFML